MTRDFAAIKNKKIYFLFAGFEIEMAGVGNAVVKRATGLKDRGYDVTLLNTDTIRDFDKILMHFRDNNTLRRGIDFINMYEYYSIKNTLGDAVKTQVEVPDGMTVNKQTSSDTSVRYDFYRNGELQKTEIYVEDCLRYRKIDDEIDYFTKDAYNYLSKSGKKLTLKNRGEKELKFSYANKFLYHFLEEVCIDGSKPFLVCDSTAHWYDIRGISNADAYKIGSMHGNPYILDDYGNVIIKPSIKHFRYLDELDSLVVLTKQLDDDLSNEFDYEHFVQIPNFVSDSLFVKRNVSKDLKRIAIFSRISPEKQISDAIRAFKTVTKKHKDARLEIYGRASSDVENEEFEKLKKMVCDLNLNNNVIFKGFVSDISAEMQKSVATLMISQNTEGLPLSLLESMASATPVISYDFKYGPMDLIENGIDGVIIESGNIDSLANQIITLLDGPEKAISMGIKAKVKIKKDYTLKKIIPMWENLFYDIYNSQDDDSKNVLDKIKGIFKF